jgi:hypothetical protein
VWDGERGVFEWIHGYFKGGFLLGADGAISVKSTGGSWLENAGQDLGVIAGVPGSACSRSLEMPNGTADRTQRGGAVGGEWRWEGLYDERMMAR